ncbi:DUF167 domain-containing protein [Sphingomonas hengshuiensis]|uniref:UPF0235 protein TS85_16670 n=1 Tax=Sphingomonas hengshuiensis TaxID=1609977 RepID=A0A7U5BG13_9SPHN|nr:DUF167 domain-containing protein [Sphingomonas hengshuiensis]AJP74588.1 hypothetical protein TS85_16670 [Sphingomonas hengshuiensis]
MPAWREAAGGIEIAVRVTPRASKDVLAAGTADHFAARLAAPPVEGAANAALVPLVAKTFRVAKRDVTLIAGETARLKRLRIAGDTAMLAGIAASLYGATP